jgi:hypothetical protein
MQRFIFEMQHLILSKMIFGGIERFFGEGSFREQRAGGACFAFLPTKMSTQVS